MRAERFIGGFAAAVLSACAPSLTSELRTLDSLTHQSVSAGFVVDRVDPSTRADVRQLLSRPLDANGAVRIALVNNRSLRATLRELGIAQGMLLQAGLLPNPAVEAEWLPERESRIELRVEYDVTSAVLAPMRAAVARADLEAARQRAAATVLRTGFEARAAFYAMQAAEQRFAIANRALDTFAAGREAARALAEAGSVSALDPATQDAAYEQARVTVAQLDLDRVRARERLNRLLGLHGDETRWSVATNLATPPDSLRPAPFAERRAVEASLELREMRGRLEAAARRAGLARTQGWLPDVSADVHTLYAEPGSLPAGESTWRFGGGVRFTLPIFDRRQGLVAAHAAEFDGLAERYVGLAVDIRSAVREWGAAVDASHARERQYATVLAPARRAVTEQTLLQYNAMQVGVFQLLQARRAQLETELAAVDARREYWTTAAAFDALLAGARVAFRDADAPASMPSAGESEGGH